MLKKKVIVAVGGATYNSWAQLSAEAGSSGPTKAALTQMMVDLGIDGLETDIVFWAETEDPQTLRITEQITMHTKEGDANMRFADSWVLRDGRIAIHFAGMVQHPYGSLA